MLHFLKQFGVLWNQLLFAVEKTNRKILSILLLPILIWSKRVGLTPLFFTSFRIFSLPILYLLFQESFVWAGIFLIILIFSDLIDGALARYLGVESDRGRFEDIFGDHVMYGVCLLGIVSLRAADFSLVAYQLLIFPILHLLAVLKKQENAETDWIIKPRPNVGYYKALFYVVLFLYLFLAKNYLDETFWVMNVLMTVESVYYFAALQTRWSRR